MADFESRHADWLPFVEALERALRLCAPLPPRAVPLGEAMGLALGGSVQAARTLPPGPTSAMDGYAVRSQDLPPEGAESILRVTGESRPGDPFSDALAPGAAMRIMTGGLLPPGADTVIPVERTGGEVAGGVRIPAGAAAGAHVRPSGEEMTEGDLLASSGDTISPWLTALFATARLTEVLAIPRPRVALLVTGSELDEIGEGVDPFRKVDVFSSALPPQIHDAGGEALPPVRVGDDQSAMVRALQEASQGADLILTTGGASMGAGDLVKRSLDTLEYHSDFWRVRIRPGSPVGGGALHVPGRERPIPVFSLPGNPVSAFITFLVLARPAIRAMGGHLRRHLPRVRATLRETIKGPDHLTHFLRVQLIQGEGGRWEATGTGPQGSGVTRSMAAADGLAILPEGVGSLYPGAEVEVVLLPHPGWLQ